MVAASVVLAAEAPRERLLMDFGWKFHLGNEPGWGTGERLDKAGNSRGPAATRFNDTAWRTVNLPHDWVVELPFERAADGSHGYKPVGPGFTTNSIGWYRKTFELPAEDRGKRLWLEFDGVYRDCLVYLNGYPVGHHESGYSSFRYDITDVANCGGRNTLVVRVDASKFEGWFYEGAGIYRHVWLVKTGLLAIAPDGIFVYTRFKDNVPKGSAAVFVRTKLMNSQTSNIGATVKWELFEPSGASIATLGWTNSFDAISQRELEALIFLDQSEPNSSRLEDDWHPGKSETVIVRASAVLWSPESPKLYKLITTVETDGQVVDRTETEFGIRTVGFDTTNGFLLNGKPYVVKGTCNHQDHAGVGSALPDALQYFRVAKLKEMGDNAIRTSHNPPTPELLEACDRLGMLVMDENRLLGSDAQNLAYLEAQVRRDRNHPSVFIWSLCNEEPVQRTPAAGRIAGTMQERVHQLDPTRLCTAAMNSWSGGKPDGISTVIDVQGFNYFHNGNMDGFHRTNPTRPTIGTEEASTVFTRGIYEPVKGWTRTSTYLSAYDENVPGGYASTAEQWWRYFAERPWASGSFVWTGFDYRGEPSPFRWPNINSEFGVIDMCGFPKDVFYYYQSWWTDKPVLHLMPHWNWPGKEGQDIDVRCFSNCEEVELFLNGQSLGRQTMPKNSHLQWMVKYAPGTLSAKGYKAGKVIAEEKVETTGAPAAIKLTPDRPTINADGEDLSIITVAVTDAQGRIIPVATNLVSFEISGAGKIIGVGNGDPICHEPDVYLPEEGSTNSVATDWKRSVFNGFAQIIVQSGKDAGEIKLTAKSDGLADTTAVINAQSHPPRPVVP
jgi:beta-galactosidase